MDIKVIVAPLIVLISILFDRIYEIKLKNRKRNEETLNSIINKAILPHNRGKSIDLVKRNIVDAGLSTDFVLDNNGKEM